MVTEVSILSIFVKAEAETERPPGRGRVQREPPLWDPRHSPFSGRVSIQLCQGPGTMQVEAGVLESWEE